MGITNPDRYGSAWDYDLDQRRRLVWERATLGAAVTLGKKPVVASRHTNFAVEHALTAITPPPPPLDSIPEWGLSNWRQIVDECLDHYGLKLTDILKRNGRSGRELACAQEVAFRLVRYGHWNGKRMSLPRVGRILRRHHSTIVHSVRQHEMRLKRLSPQFRAEDVDE